MTFSLVPGGTFRPGYGRDRLDRLKAILRAEEDEEFEDEEPGPDEPGHAFLLKAPVAISPFFAATELVRPGLPGLRSVVTLSEEAVEGKHLYGFEFMGDAVEFPWKQVEPVLAAYGWP